MRVVAAVLALASVLSCAALAQPKPAKPAKPTVAGGPQELGKFDDWIAATHEESGQGTCYAFVRASNSAPALSGRGEVVLTVTERPTGRDWVAITAGFPYRKDSAVTMQVGTAESLRQGKDSAVTMQVGTAGFDFYTSASSAFARDGKAVVAALQKGEQAQARSPGPREGQVVVDTFSLHGFSAAYAAIVKACPAR